MTIIIGVVLAAVLFGLFTMLKPRNAGCTGHCVGCTGDQACEKDGVNR